MKSQTLYDAISQRLGKRQLNKLVHISLKNKYIYLSVPKAANSTIKGILQEVELTGSYLKAPRRLHNRATSPLIAPYQLPVDNFTSIINSGEFYKFTLVRNPFSRLLSCYLDRVKAKNSTVRKEILEKLNKDNNYQIQFEEFINVILDIDPQQMNIHYRPQTLLTCFDLINFDEILKFEEFPENFSALLSKVCGDGIQFDLEKNLSPKRTNATDKVNQYFDRHLKRKIAQKYQQDFTTFGYLDSL